MLRRHRSILAGALGALALGCSGEASPETCDTMARPAFALSLQMQQGPLPADTRLRVSYGSGEEIFSLAAPSARPRVLFCVVAATDEASRAPQALACELWTDGPATLEVTGGEAPPLERQLAAQRDECGLVTVREALVFGAAPETG